AVGPDRLWRFTVPIALVVRRQPAPHQPRLADRRRPRAGGGLRRLVVLGRGGRFRRGQEVQAPVARRRVGEFLRRYARGSATIVPAVYGRPGPLAGRLRAVPRAEDEARRCLVSRVAGRARPPRAG